MIFLSANKFCYKIFIFSTQWIKLSLRTKKLLQFNTGILDMRSLYQSICVLFQPISFNNNNIIDSTFNNMIVSNYLISYVSLINATYVIHINNINNFAKK